MGGDGGSIPTRRCLVKYKPKVIKKDHREDDISRYGFCQLTANRLKRPIVISRLGKLYNKDAVLSFLIDHGGEDAAEDIIMKIDGFVSIKNFKKNFFDVELTDNPKYEKKNIPGTSFINDFQFMCPTTNLEMNGAQQFVYGSASKQMVSEKALRLANAEYMPKGKKLDKDELHPLYSEEYEANLVCPITSLWFGHPIHVYPSTRNEIMRAHNWQPIKKKKSKKRKLAIEDGQTTLAVKDVEVEYLSTSKSKKPRAIQKNATSVIAQLAVRTLATNVAGEASTSKDLDKYRELRLIGDTQDLETENALAQMFSSQRSYFA